MLSNAATSCSTSVPLAEYGDSVIGDYWEATPFVDESQDGPEPQNANVDPGTVYWPFYGL